MANLTYGTNIRYGTADPTGTPAAGEDILFQNNTTGHLWRYDTFNNVWSCLSCAGSSVGATNGLYYTSPNVKLGGTLVENTSIAGASLYDLAFTGLDTFAVATAHSPVAHISTLDMGSTSTAGVNLVNKSATVGANQSTLTLSNTSGNLFRFQKGVTTQIQQYENASLDLRTDISASDGLTGASVTVSKNNVYVKADGLVSNPILEIDSNSGTSSLRISQASLKMFEIGTPFNNGDFTTAALVGDTVLVSYQGGLKLASRFGQSVQIFTGSADDTDTGETARLTVSTSGITQTHGGRAVATRTVTTSTSATATDEVIFVQNGATAVNITLPAASAVTGRSITVARLSPSSAAITVAGTSSTIEDGTTGAFGANTALGLFGTGSSKVTFTATGAVWVRTASA